MDSIDGVRNCQITTAKAIQKKPIDQKISIEEKPLVEAARQIKVARQYVQGDMVCSQICENSFTSTLLIINSKPSLSLNILYNAIKVRTKASNCSQKVRMGRLPIKFRNHIVQLLSHCRTIFSSNYLGQMSKTLCVLNRAVGHHPANELSFPDSYADISATPPYAS